MPLRIEFHPAAEDEILTAFSWYDARSSIAASAFVHEVNLVVQRMAEAPHRWPKFPRDTRHIVFPRFPFSLVYRVTTEAVKVIAVAHQSRRPGYWKSRK